MPCLSYLSHFSKGAVAALLFVFASLQAAAQGNDVGLIERQFDKYSNLVLHEKVFVHTDRHFYTAGEIVWFKAYCMDDDGKLSGLSKVAYVEILDKDQQPVLQGKIALANGTGSGSIVLPPGLPTGNYLFRAYTNWMKNFDADYYFHQPLTIINPLQASTPDSPSQTGAFAVGFFPEGGDMVSDLASKIAFKATDNAGKGIDFRGVLLDQNNDTILRFQPLAFGIGNFVFTPKKNMQYRALIKAAGKSITQPLPPARNSGYVMNVTDHETAGRLKLTVQTNTDSRFVYLFVHGSRQVKTARVLNIVNGKAETEIDKAQLSDGISNITIIDVYKEPVCERLYFKRPQSPLLIEGTTDATAYLTRKKITIDLAATTAQNEPAASELSMAVYLVDSLPATHNDIHSYQWLSSELKGNIESPEYYFRDSTTSTNEPLDNLLLTHGWRRFKVKDVLMDKQPVLTFLPEYEGHLVSGTVVNTATEMPVANIPTFLSLPGRHFQLYQSKSQKDGTVHFNTIGLQGTKLMVALVNSPDTASYRVDLSNPFSERFSSYKLQSLTSFALSPSALLRRSINTQVQNVYAANKLNVFKTAKADSLNFYGKPDYTYLLDDFTRFPTMEEVLREYVLPIAVRKRQDKFYLTIVDKDEFGNPTVKNPVILLDGLPQFDHGDKITTYNPLKVQRLETINSEYYLGATRFDGIASFFTYKGDLEGFALDSSATILDYEGLQLRRAFYSPAYNTPNTYSSPLPDFRTLLYWSPDVKTGANGKTQVEFYSSDLNGKYAVVVQGITPGGQTGSTTFTIAVKK